MFLKSTKMKSRVLFLVWLVFGFAGAGGTAGSAFGADQYIISFSVSALVFLLPAILIEYSSNPAIISIRESHKAKYNPPHNTSNKYTRFKKYNHKSGEQSNAELIRKERLKHLWENGGKERLEQYRLEQQQSIPSFENNTLNTYHNHNPNADKSNKHNSNTNKTTPKSVPTFSHYTYSTRPISDVAPTYNSDISEYYHTHDISEIDGMNGHDFENFCADLLREHSFVDVKVTKGSGDQGVDILAKKGGVKYAIQCKNYASPLSNKPIQEVNAGRFFYDCHVGVVLTNSTFTPGAKALAEKTGVLLWDREKMQEMLYDAL